MEMSIRFPHLGLEFDYVPRAISLWGFEITIYGILIAAGMLLGMALMLLEAGRNHENQDDYLGMSILSIAAAILGARLFYVIFSWDLFRGDPMKIFNIREGGFVFYGGLLGGTLAGAFYCRAKKLSFWQMADNASMGILTGQILGRWGNFFNRESFGEYTDRVTAMQLPLSAVRSGEVTPLMREQLVTVDGISYIQAAPVFLYESLWCLLILGILLWLRRRKKFQGELFMTYLADYGIGRFFLEGLRTDGLFLFGTGLLVSRLISIALFIVFGMFVTIRRMMVKKREALRKRKQEEAYEAEEREMQSAWEKSKKEAETDLRGVAPVADPLPSEKAERQDRNTGGPEEKPEAEPKN